MIVSTHSRPKAAGFRSIAFILRDRVSTHSRPKAAGNCTRYNSCSCVSFNTQPPEGGWSRQSSTAERLQGFQHTAARRRLAYIRDIIGKAVRFQHTAARRRLGRCFEPPSLLPKVSTHSRPKAAGSNFIPNVSAILFQHTAARRRLVKGLHPSLPGRYVSTHSRPKAAGYGYHGQHQRCRGFNTQPPEGGW